jgi:hypothetical protein
MPTVDDELIVRRIPERQSGSNFGRADVRAVDLCHAYGSLFRGASYNANDLLKCYSVQLRSESPVILVVLPKSDFSRCLEGGR